MAAASRRGPEGENVDLRPTAAAARAQKILTGCPRVRGLYPGLGVERHWGQLTITLAEVNPVLNAACVGMAWRPALQLDAVDNHQPRETKRDFRSKHRWSTFPLAL